MADTIPEHNDLGAAHFTKRNVPIDVAAHNVQEIVSAEEELHQAVKDTEARVEKDAALSGPVSGETPLPPPTGIAEDLPEHPKFKPQNSRFGLYAFLKRKMEQKVNKAREEKTKEAQRAA